jgi:GTPase SAR1 family protein
MEEQDRITITICGDGGCGKSSITLRLVRSEWTSEYARLSPQALNNLTNGRYESPQN